MSRHALSLDCDGVLADTELDGHLVAFNETFEHFGLPFRWSAEKYDVLLAVGGGKERFILRPTEGPSPTMDEREYRNWSAMVDAWEEMA